MRIALAMGTMPRGLHGLKSAMFVVDDLWLYAYDNRKYRKLTKDTFDTIQRIENLKWSYLSFHNLLPEFRDRIGLSNYTDFSNEKYWYVEGLDGSFIRSTWLFFLTTIPETLLLCLILRKLFSFIRNY